MSVAAPAAFGFSSGIFADNIDLNLNNVGLKTGGGNLSLIGGPVKIGGGEVNTDGGNLQIISAAGPGEVAVGNVAAHGLRALGPVEIKSSFMTAGTEWDTAEGGQVVIRGGRIFMQGGEVSSSGKQGSQDLDIQSSGELILTDAAWLMTTTSGDGKAGDIRLDGQTVRIENSGYVSSDSFGSGDSGTVSISAGRSLSISGPQGIKTESSAEGNAGGIYLQAPEVALDSGAHVNSAAAGTGAAGPIRVEGRQIAVTASQIASQSASSANASVHLLADRLYFTAGSRVLAVADGPAELTLSGGTIDADGNSLIVSNGAGSRLTVQAERLTVTGNAQVGSSGGHIQVAAKDFMLDHAALNTDTARGSGNTDIEVDTERLTVQNGGIIATLTRSGDGGNIRISAAEFVQVQGSGSAVFTQTLSTGKGGDVTIRTPRTEIMDGAAVGTNTLNEGDGGKVSITAPVVTGSGASSILAIASGGGNAGSVVLNVEHLSLSGGTQVNTRTTGSGQAGHISINSKENPVLSVYLLGTDTNGKSTGLIASTLGSGQAGTIEIFAKELLMEGRLDENGQRIEDGALVQAVSFAGGDAGSITLDLDALTLKHGSRIIKLGKPPALPG